MIMKDWRPVQHSAIVGMDADTDPAKLADGYVPDLLNMQGEGGRARMRVKLRKLTNAVVPWSVIALPRAFFDPETYGDTQFAVNDHGWLYWLNRDPAGDTWEAVPEPGGAVPSSPPFEGVASGESDFVRSAQLEDKLVMTDGECMVMAYVDELPTGDMLVAQEMEVRPSPPCPVFSEANWCSSQSQIGAGAVGPFTIANVLRIDDYIEPDDGNLVPVGCTRYCLTFVWDNGEEGPPGEMSEPFYWIGLGWLNEAIREVPLIIPPYTAPSPRPAYVAVYRSMAKYLHGTGGDVGWSGFHYVGRLAIGDTAWTDGGEPGAEEVLLSENLSAIPVGKFLTIGGDPERLAMADVKERTDEQPSSGLTLSSGSYFDPPEERFRYRQLIHIGSWKRALYGGGALLKFQNSDSTSHDLSGDGDGGYLPEEVVPDLSQLAEYAGAGLWHWRSKLAFTYGDGKTRLPFRVVDATSDTLRARIFLPHVPPGLGTDIYVYFDPDADFQEPCNRAYLGMRIPAADDEEFRTTGGLISVDVGGTGTLFHACSGNDERQGFDMIGNDAIGYAIGFETYGIRCYDDEHDLMERDVTTFMTPNSGAATYDFSRDVVDITTGTVHFIIELGDFTDNLYRTVFRLLHGVGNTLQVQVRRQAVGGIVDFKVVELEAGGVDIATDTLLPAERFDDDDHDWYFVTVAWDKNAARGHLSVSGVQDGAINKSVFMEADKVDADLDTVLPQLLDGVMDFGTLQISDVRLLQRFQYNGDHLALAAFEPEPYWTAMIQGVHEDLDEIARHCHRMRNSAIKDPLVWPVTGYKDFGAEGRCATMLKSYQGHLCFGKKVGVWPILARTGGALEYPGESGLTETVQWDPRTLSPEQKGFVGCSVDDAATVSPEGIWMLSGTSIIRYDLEKFWDHTAGIRTHLVAAEDLLTTARLVYDPTSRNLILAWYDGVQWTMRALHKDQFQGKDIYGWCRHSCYSPEAVGQTVGCGSQELLIGTHSGNSSHAYVFDQYTELDEACGMNEIPWMVQTPHYEAPRIAMYSLLALFENMDFIGCQIYYKRGGSYSLVKTIEHMMTNEQYRLPLGAVQGAYFIFRGSTLPFDYPAR